MLREATASGVRVTYDRPEFTGESVDDVSRLHIVVVISVRGSLGDVLGSNEHFKRSKKKRRNAYDILLDHLLEVLEMCAPGFEGNDE